MKSSTKTIKPIAVIHTDFVEKFGIPRQSLQVKGLMGTIIFEPEFRHPDALKGIEQFSHLWLIWDFSKNDNSVFHATVKPPRLGGNTHVGVFASRASFRPNGMGLSVVKLVEVKDTEKDGLILVVEGADLLDGTPIYDIKPYIPVSDCIEDARGGYTEETCKHRLEVEFPEKLLEQIPEEKRIPLMGILEQDPRPRYGVDENREFGVAFAGDNIKFVVNGDTLTVTGVEKNYSPTH